MCWLCNSLHQCSAVVKINLLVLHLLDFMLGSKLLDDLEVNNDGIVLYVIAVLVLERETQTFDDLLGSKGNVDTRCQVLDPTCHPSRLVDGRHMLLDPHFIKTAQGLWKQQSG